MLATKIFSSPHDEDHEVAWSRNLMVYKTQQLLEENEELGQIRFLVTLFFTLVQLCSCATVCNLVQPLKKSLYLFRVVRKESLNMYTQIG